MKYTITRSKPNPRSCGKGPGRRRQRKADNLSARQQRLQRQALPGKPHDRMNARRYTRLLDRMLTPGEGAHSRHQFCAFDTKGAPFNRADRRFLRMQDEKAAKVLKRFLS